MKITRHHTTDY